MSRKSGHLSRRKLLGGVIAGPAAVPFVPSWAGAANMSQFDTADLRGTIDAGSQGLIAGTTDDQSRLLQAVLDRASEDGKPVFLPPGIYLVSNITLPENTRITGVPGATRLAYSGGGHFLMSRNASHVELTGLVLDGQNRAVDEYAGATLSISGAGLAVIDNCQIVGSLETGIRIDRSRGRIERTTVSGAMGLCGIYALENRGLSILNNQVGDCSNGGISIHRWQSGEDRTIVSGNRVFQIGATEGGTGQNGNGIKVFRADSVMVANNFVHDCAYSAIRANASSNIQVTGNHCARSGETAIHAEFAYNGAMIANNVVDGGASGISIANFRDGGRMAVCTGNLVRNIDAEPPNGGAGDFGSGISVEADATVTGNVIENIARFGLVLGWGPYLRDVVASSNVIRDAETGIYVSVVDGAANTVISDNVISGSRKGAIIGYLWDKPVTKDMGSGNNFGYRHLELERNRVG